MPSVKIKRIKYQNGIRGLQSRAETLGRQIRYGVGRSAGSYPNGASVLDVATWNADGTSKIPARNFFAKFYNQHFVRGGGGKNLVTVASNYTRSVIRGKLTAAKAVKQIGNTGLALLRKIVTDWADPPNALSTIKRKGRNDPLVHTRKLLNSLAWWESKAKF